MKRFKKRRDNWVYSQVSVIVLLIVALFIWNGVWGVYKKESVSRHKADELKVQVDELEERKEQLTLRVEDLETDKGKSREIREKFDVVREGERVAILIDPKEATTTEEAPEKSFWGKLLWWK